ncbi:ALBINO3-like protein 2, chloroplastic [Malania oleifera]|uniref:ALBINO3-like protein 2, chloroplastic n=1 Tax=Malania oleifera TaxID=397392 RepID=UPI0025AE7669|nr:ALBINO3-like protein 2, chloroplastic [Malania oleifera]
MAALKLFSLLRRRQRPFSSLPPSIFLPSCYRAAPTPWSLSPPVPPPSPHPIPSRRPLHFLPSQCLLACSTFQHYSRSFSIGSSSTDDSESGELSLGVESTAELELLDVEIGRGGGGGGGLEVVGGSCVSDYDSIFPVRAVISLLDGFHDLTGLPWWIVIASSTLALRLLLFPVLVLQLNKLKRISKLFPKLPPPLPPPLSGRSYVDQLALFLKEKRAIGCPSILWFFAYVSVQIPCFLLWMTSVRRMSLDHHPGFDSGGTLWFQNLTEFPHGLSSPIFPFLIAGLHYTNVQLSFRTTSVGKMTGLIGLLAKYYKFYLNFLSLPIFFIGFCVPQGSLVYWVTNATLTSIQQLYLNNPAVRKKLGLPDKKDPVGTVSSKELDAPDLKSLDPLKSQGKITVQNLSPQELLSLSIKLLAQGQKDRAILLLQLALDKDPEYIRALVVMGQTLLQKGLPADATEYLERAISKLFLVGHPTEAEEVDLLILASQWAGVAFIRQGKNAEGIVHLQRVANLKEPEEQKSRAHYFDGLLLLASALYNEGRKAEAVKYLRILISYNPAYSELLEQCEKDDDAFVNDLVSSRRGDY